MDDTVSVTGVTPPPKGGGLWWSVGTTVSGHEEVRRFHGYDDGLAPGGGLVAADEVPATSVPVGMMTATTDERQVLSIVLARRPNLWWLALPETAAKPPAMVLVAFEDPVREAGNVVDDRTFRELSVDVSHQVGAIRWWPKTGQVHQIYVAPMSRRTGVGRSLAFAASAYSIGRGWPRIWGDGRRTDLGEAFVSGASGAIAGRVLPRASVEPAMTRPEATTGVPHRLLFPDRASAAD